MINFAAVKITDKLRMKVRFPIILLLFLQAFICSKAQDAESRTTILWKDIFSYRFSDLDSVPVLMFEGANYFEETGTLPVYFKRVPLEKAGSDYKVLLKNLIFEDLPLTDPSLWPELANLKDSISVNTTVSYERRKPFLTFSFVPIRKNGLLGNYEKLVSFTVEIIPSPGQENGSDVRSVRSYVQASVLTSGNWYRMAVQNTGIHIINYQQLSAMGINPAAIDPRNIRIYGNGGGMLPENTSVARNDDLAENAIQVVGEEDGHFDEGDYILFYGESPVSWTYNSLKQQFEHANHLYSDRNYYFLTADLGPGKRISPEESTTSQVTDQVSSFNDFAAHELDQVNLIKSGRQWFGELFDMVTEYTLPFEFPNIDQNSTVYLKAGLVARSTSTSSFTVTADGHVVTTSVASISTQYNSQYARKAVAVNEFLPSGAGLNVRIRYNKSTSSSIGWLDFIELNVRRHLIMSGDQMPFRDAQSIGNGKISEFTVGNASGDVKIWDVTDPVNTRLVDATLSGGNLIFRLATDTLREFIAFNGKSFYSPEFIETVVNQNLHGLGQTDLVIVSHPLFLEQARALGQHHADLDGLRFIVVTPQEIYNEFSSGAQDISAIRDFIKMFYDRSPSGNEPRYLLLFGDGSYDNMNRMPSNTNFIPTYQSDESLHPVLSYVTDDYYGFLDYGEGTNEADMLDIGVGRLPVASVEEAQAAIDKIFHYSIPSEEVMGDWRNNVCFIADDEDSNIHFIQAEGMANYVDTAYPDYNVNKIYLDSYKQVSTPGGERYPDVNQAINDQVEQGTLIINYTGHGGEVGWAHERILEISDINNWRNFDNMPVFVTATCEFSRFDDPGRVSAGEYVFLNPHGGGLALFSTSRATFGSPNYNLNKSFYTYAFDKIDGHFPTMGDIIRLSKRESGSDNNGRKFVLLGDPAQRLAYPRENVITSTVNYRDVNSEPDTLNALSEVIITGMITDDMGRMISDFNGTIHTTVFDKPLVISTLANDGDQPRTFEIRKSLLYKGKTTVTDGVFSLNFIVPKDIAYKYGYGKISYYAENGITDANGYNDNIIIGGFNKDASLDQMGPEIHLYMNDTNFLDGGMTNENPVLLAIVSDESGINTVGNGIGHDITAILDDKSEDIKVLNDFYESDLNTYKSGSVRYPFFGLSEGPHQIKFKIWDAFNNSSEETINFVVRGSDSFTIGDMINYPNPFRDYTNFSFEHNSADQILDITIDIFSITGQRVKSIRSSGYAEGYRIAPIRWDGTDDNGFRLRAGIYLYRAGIRSNYGEYAEKSAKLVIYR
ncbi:MAG: type IX secretion system sortase PorU [Bacteroidetes bacterium]|nr:type IX secretion system sortase PorU [Bacteroidota bacterium]